MKRGVNVKKGDVIEVLHVLFLEIIIGEEVPPLKGVPMGASTSFYIEVEDINTLYQEIKPKA